MITSIRQSTVAVCLCFVIQKLHIVSLELLFKKMLLRVEGYQILMYTTLCSAFH